MPSKYLIGTDNMGFEGHPLREFDGDFDSYQVVAADRPGRSDRFKFNFANVEVRKSVVPYPYKTATIEMNYPNEQQIERAMGIPPRSPFGVWMGSLSDVVEEKTDLNKMVKSKLRLRVEATERSRSQQDAEGNDTGETIEWLEWRAVAVVGKDGSDEGLPATTVSLDAQFLALIPDDGANATEIGQLYVGSELKGKLDKELFGQELLPRLVAEGKLVLGEDGKYSKV